MSVTLALVWWELRLDGTPISDIRSSECSAVAAWGIANNCVATVLAVVVDVVC